MMANSKITTRTARSAAQRSGARKKGAMSTRSGREKKMMIVIALLAVALISSIGVAVAAFSTDLYIRGTATVRSTIWDIHFENLQPVVTVGNAKEVTAPTIQSSVDNNPLAAIKNYDVELKDPGDSVEYTFDVANGGDMNAVLNAITINTGTGLSCASAAGQDVADKVCAKLNYTLKYADGTTVAVGDTLAKATGGTATTRTMKLKLEFDASATSADLPSKDVTISGLAVILSYGQDTTNN